MTDWLPILAGLLIIAVAAAIVRFAPDSTWGQELRRSYGIRPSGARGHRTRRDHLKSAGLAALLAVALEGTAIGVGWLSVNTVDPETRNIADVYTFIAFILAAMATIATMRSVWKAALWRVELPDTPEHRRGLADAIDRLLDGDVPTEVRAEFLDVRYVHPQLEQIRRATLKLASQHKAGLPESYREQIKQWTAGIRASAGPRRDG